MSNSGRVFILDDDELIVSMLSRALRNEGYDVRTETEAHDVINKLESWSPDVLLLDIKLPDRDGMDILQELMTRDINTQVVMLTADDTAESAVKAMKLGAVDYLTKPFHIDEVKIIVRNLLEKEMLKQEVNYLRKVTADLIERDIIGESSAIKEIKSKVEKIAQARVSTILITGESGTGKELVARYIHHLLHGDLDSGYTPFIGINCAALPESLLESELFGHEKGSFTDAKSEKKGLFELAAGGSILLDEIGDMKDNLQGKLLRVLEERTIRRIGGKDEIPIDVTVIATTHRNISDAVEKGQFRMDLFYRLNAFSLHILPLKERREDIPVLARHFLSSFATKYNKKRLKGFSREAEKILLSYSWPGNVRELKNVIERIVVLESADMILPEHLPKEISNQSIPVSQMAKDRFVLPPAGLSLDALEKDLILQALQKANHNKTQAAKLLNISYDSLRYQIKKFGLE
ncbi:MAG: response regulator [Proteobacteria bacterium]|nr:response regulator [Pseudomonadota bacterium]